MENQKQLDEFSKPLSVEATSPVVAEPETPPAVNPHPRVKPPSKGRVEGEMLEMEVH